MQQLSTVPFPGKLEREGSLYLQGASIAEQSRASMIPSLMGMMELDMAMEVGYMTKKKKKKALWEFCETLVAVNSF